VSPPPVTALIRAHRDGWLVNATLEHVAPYVSRTLLAIDERTPPQDIALMRRSCADELLILPHVTPVERVSARLMSRFADGWVLNIAGDEWPGYALLESLPTVTTLPVTHVDVPVTWLWPDARHALVGWPWMPDQQSRLIRADASIRRSAGVLHSGRQIVGDGRLVDTPHHHLDLLVSTTEARRAKVARYTAQDERLRAFNERQYLPEDATPVAPVVPIDPRDADALATLLETRGTGTGRRSRPRRPLRPSRMTLDEADALWLAHPDPPEIALDVAVPDAGDWPADSARRVRVTVTCSGSREASWGIAPFAPVTLAPAWAQRGAGDVQPRALPSTPLPGPVLPGETAPFDILVTAPGPGSWTLEVRAVDRHGTALGAAALNVDVDR